MRNAALFSLYTVGMFLLGAAAEHNRIAIPVVQAEWHFEPAPPPAATSPLPTAEAVIWPSWLPGHCKGAAFLFRDAGREFGIDPVLLSIVSLVESGCGRAQVSPMGAQGWMQVMPPTAAGIAQRIGESLPGDWTVNPGYNIRLGASEMAYQMSACASRGAGGDAPDWQETVECACIGYNAGGGKIPNYLATGSAPAESLRHARFVGGMWRERLYPDSPMFQEWSALVSKDWTQ